MEYKIFLKYFLILTIIAIFLDFLAVEIFARKVLIPNDVIYKKEEILASRKDSVRIVSFGDSHVLYDMRLDSKDYFNFGMDSEPAPLWYFKLKWLLKNNQKIDLVLLQFDYHTFSHYRTENIEHLTEQYSKYIDEKVDARLGYYPNPKDYKKFNLYSTQINYAKIVHRALLDFIMGKLNKPNLLEDGTLAMNSKFLDLTPQKREKKAKKRANSHLSGVVINNDLLDYYEKAINLAKINGVRVVLVRYPLSNEYQKFVTKEIDDKFKNLADAFLNKRKVSILDYRNIFESKQEFFNDSDHLNIDGANEFGKIVLNDLLKLK